MRPKVKIGDTVFLKTDEDQSPRICVGYTVRERSVQYCLANGTEDSWHYQAEINHEKIDKKKVRGFGS